MFGEKCHFGPVLMHYRASFEFLIQKHTRNEHSMFIYVNTVVIDSSFPVPLFYRPCGNQHNLGNLEESHSFTWQSVEGFVMCIRGLVAVRYSFGCLLFRCNRPITKVVIDVCTMCQFMWGLWASEKGHFWVDTKELFNQTSSVHRHKGVFGLAWKREAL